MLLQNKAILVTGGSRGIGRSIVKDLVDNGASVAFTYASQHARAKALLDECKGKQVFAIQTDVRDTKKMQQVAEEVVSKYGKIDGLVNNAGILNDKPLMLMDREVWQEVLDVNLTGVFNACKAVIIKFMKQKYGKIVSVTSISGIVGMAGQVNYSSSKAGIIGLTKALAKEVAAYNINVNAVAPGYIQTDMLTNLSDEKITELKKRIPMGKFGEPSDISSLVTILLGPASDYITGEVFVVDGGLSLGF